MLTLGVPSAVIWSLMNCGPSRHSAALGPVWRADGGFGVREAEGRIFDGSIRQYDGTIALT